jgi:hypothetical protein
MKAPGKVLTAPSAPSVSAAPAPLIVAQSVTNKPAITCVVPKRTMPVPTTVPKTLAASLAPRDQPRTRPLERKIRGATSMALSITGQARRFDA